LADLVVDFLLLAVFFLLALEVAFLLLAVVFSTDLLAANAGVAARMALETMTHRARSRVGMAMGPRG
jgi:hypothetical protein